MDVVQACQAAKVLSPGSTEIMAVSVWGQVHGIVSLALEGQISHTGLDRRTVQDIVSYAIDQVMLS